MKTLRPLLTLLFLACTFALLSPADAAAQGTPLPEDERPYQYVEQMPEFNGGSEAFTNFLYDSLTYPPEAIVAKQTGVARVRFIVRPDGTIRDAQTLTKMGYGLDEEAVRLVKLTSGHWKPGSQNGKLVHVAMDVTIDFSRKAPFEVPKQDPKQNRKAKKQKN
ncbi:energy transducer TonB [Pontibacter sp. Tf4]|uniref:energy transducer TonB n=1 Tax=Pontibacter sp. Tf4 TaxID=2761620 RepID=UPI001624FCF8|nr:energy transducer TonB [Pontibacter sp. Tf4]MBB6611160.1 energy transducer TonB [Pontibacter sp. Tf4]